LQRLYALCLSGGKDTIFRDCRRFLFWVSRRVGGDASKRREIASDGLI